MMEAVDTAHFNTDMTNSEAKNIDFYGIKSSFDAVPCPFTIAA